METSKRPARKRYSQEEKDKALKLIKELGYSVQQAAYSTRCASYNSKDLAAAGFK